MISKPVVVIALQTVELGRQARALRAIGLFKRLLHLLDECVEHAAIGLRNLVAVLGIGVADDGLTAFHVAGQIGEQAGAAGRDDEFLHGAVPWWLCVHRTCISRSQEVFLRFP